MTLFDRCWQLKIQLDTGEAKVYQKLAREEVGLSISFKCDAIANSLPPGGDLVITGLPDSMITYLGTNYESSSGMLKPSLVEFSAGYDGNLSLLMVGNIYQSSLSLIEADHAISLKIMTGLQQNQLNSFASVSLGDNATLRDVLANLANRMKCSLEIDNKLNNKIIGDYSFQGSPTKQLTQLRSQYPDIEFTVGNNKLIAKNKGSQDRAVRYVLTPTSGLLGAPQPTPMGVNLTTYLLGNLYIHDFIELRSHKLSQLNGIYEIMKLTHQGDSRGQAWKSQLTCLRRQLFTPL